MFSNPSINVLPVAQAYRSLYRAGLHAVQYSSPARHTLKRILRTSFRNGEPMDFKPDRIANTIVFLENAARETGMEHKILKSLLHTRYWQIQYDARLEKYGYMPNSSDFADMNRCKGIVPWGGPIHKAAYSHFDITLDMLNESMQLCLR